MDKKQELRGMVAEYVVCYNMKRDCEARMNELKSAIIAEMGGMYGRVAVGGHIVTYGHSSRVCIDTKSLKADFPDIYSEYGKISSYDTFVVK